MLSWPLTKGTEYFKRPVLLGGEQPKIADSVDSTESKQKESIHPSVQRQFTPIPLIVSVILSVRATTETQPNQKELLLDFSFSSLSLLTSKSFETTQI
jgi:hypothetical protein